MKKSFLPLVCAFLLTGVISCSTDDSNEPSRPKPRQISPRVENLPTSYQKQLFCLRNDTLIKVSAEMDTVIFSENSSKYQFGALALSSEANLSLPQWKSINDSLVLIDYKEETPDIWFGLSAKSNQDETQTLSIPLRRKTSGMRFELQLPSYVLEANVSLIGVKNCMRLSGESFATSARLSKYISFTKNPQTGLFEGEVPLLPDTAKSMDVIFFLKFGGGSSESIQTKITRSEGILSCGETTLITRSDLPSSQPNNPEAPCDGSIQIPLTATSFSTNAPMQYQTDCWSSDEHNNIALTPEEAEARAKFFSTANLVDNDTSTLWSSNFDIYSVESSWAFRPGVPVANHYLQIDLGEEVSLVNIKTTNAPQSSASQFMWSSIGNMGKRIYQISSDGVNWNGGIYVLKKADGTPISSSDYKDTASEFGAVYYVTDLQNPSKTPFRYIRINVYLGCTSVGSLGGGYGWMSFAEVSAWKLP